MSIVKNSLLFSIFVFLAQVLGLIRDLYLAKVFGVGQILDTYYLAFKIPDFLNIFYSVFLGSVIFIPLLTKAKNFLGELDNKQEVQNKINSIGSLVLFLLILVFALLILFMPFLVSLLVPLWTLEQRELLVSLSRILLCAQFFFPLGILGGSIGMIYKSPYGMAISGFIYNFGILIFALFLVPLFGIYGLVFSVVLGASLFMLVQICSPKVLYFYKNFKFVWDPASWKIFVRENLGRFFAVITYQIYGVFILSLASLSGPGGVSAFSIAYNIYLAAFFILGASFATVLMPNISESHERGEKEIQKKNLRKSLVLIFALSFLAGLILFFSSHLIIQILYHFSNLSTEKEIYIATLLSMLANSFPFFNVLEVVRKYLYATRQIFLAGGLTVFMFVNVGIFTFVLTTFSTKPLLTCLIFGLNISLFLSTVLILVILKFKKQI